MRRATRDLCPGRLQQYLQQYFCHTWRVNARYVIIIHTGMYRCCITYLVRVRNTLACCRMLTEVFDTFDIMDCGCARQQQQQQCTAVAQQCVVAGMGPGGHNASGAECNAFVVPGCCCCCCT